MGFYEWRLQVSLSAAQERQQPIAHRGRPETVSVVARLRRGWHGLSASLAVLLGARQSRTTTLVAFAFGAVFSVSSAGLAETSDEPAQFAVLGIGSAPCTNFVRAVSKSVGFTDADRLAMLAWAQGYLSFYNSVSEGTYDVTHGSGPVALQQWLVEFCQKNPRGLFISALDQLLLTGGHEQPVLGAVTR
jgi:hypothetical protein